MTTETLETLLVSIEGNTALLREELQRGSADVGTFARKTDSDVSKIEQRFKGFGRNLLQTLGVGLSVSWAANFTRDAIQTADAVGETAEAADVGAERFQRLGFVFKQNGVDANEYESAMRTLNTRFGTFLTTGAGPVEKALEELGLKQRVLNGEIRTAEDLFDAAADALSREENAAKRAAISAGLFGREAGAKMAETMSLGTAAINESAEAASGIFSDETVRQGSQLTDVFSRMAKTVGGELKSGLVDATYQLAQLFNLVETVDVNDKLAELERNMAQFGEGFKLTDVGKRMQVEIDDLRAQIENRKRFSTGGSFGGPEKVDLSEDQGGSGPKLSPELSTLIAQLEFEDKLRQQMATDLAKGQDLSPELTELVRELEDAAKLTESMRTDAEKQVEQWEKATRLFDEGFINEETLNRLRDDLLPGIEVGVKRIGAATDEQADKMEQLAGRLGRGLQSTLADVFLGIDTSFGDLLRNMAAELAASAVMKGIGSLFASSAAGPVGFLGALFGGAFAEGGRPPVGMPSLIGEGGPELWIPDTPGRILSNAQTKAALAGAGGSLVFNNSNNVTVSGANSPNDTAAAVSRAMEANNRTLLARIQDLRRRGRF